MGEPLTERPGAATCRRVPLSVSRSLDGLRKFSTRGPKVEGRRVPVAAPRGQIGCSRAVKWRNTGASSTIR
jgi:hypothetical protein